MADGDGDVEQNDYDWHNTGKARKYRDLSFSLSLSLYVSPPFLFYVKTISGPGSSSS